MFSLRVRTIHVLKIILIRTSKNEKNIMRIKTRTKLIKFHVTQ